MFRKYPAIGLLGAVICGIVVADHLHVASWQFLVAGLVGGILALLAYFRSAFRTAAVFGIVALGFLSGFNFVNRYLDRGPNHIAKVATSRDAVRIYGRVSDWPDLRIDHTDYLVDLDSIVTSRLRHVYGRILLKVTDTTTALQRGDRIEFYGRIYFVDPAAAENNAYLRRLNLKGVAGTVYLPTLLDVRVDRRMELGLFATVDRIRTFILNCFERDLTPEASALAGGFLLGQTRYVSPEVYTLFRDSGTLHVLAVSGSNVALVLLFVLLLLRPFGLRQPWRGIILLAVVGMFALLSYGEPSVVRASIMAVFVLIAGLLGREYDLNQIVAMTVLVVLAIEPGQLYDIGFQLSVVTAWGLVLLVKPLTALFERWHNRRWYRYLLFPVIVSIVAQVCSAPLIAFYFGRVPIATVFANLIVVPLASLVTIAVLVLVVAHFIWPILGLFVGSLVDPIIRLIIGVLGWFKSLALPQIETGPLMYRSMSVVWILFYFVLVISLVFAVRSRWARKLAVYVVLIGINVGLVAAAMQTKQSGATVHLAGLPGGLVAVVERPRSEECDFVFSSSLLKIDNLDSRLLQPVLDMYGIKRVQRLFVLACPYDNIDDLMRISVAYRCQTMYVAIPNRPSFEDYQVFHGDSVHPFQIEYFGGQPILTDQPGVYLGDNRILLQSPNRSVLIANRLPQDTAEDRFAAGSEPILVLATRWAPRPEDWIDLRDRGYARVICSRIEQLRTLSEDFSPKDQIDQVSPDFVVDLRKTGPYHLPL